MIWYAMIQYTIIIIQSSVPEGRSTRYLRRHAQSSSGLGGGGGVGTIRRLSFGVPR